MDGSRPDFLETIIGEKMPKGLTEEEVARRNEIKDNVLAFVKKNPKITKADFVAKFGGDEKDARREFDKLIGELSIEKVGVIKKPGAKGAGTGLYSAKK